MRPSEIYKIYGFYDPKWCIRVPREPYGPHRIICNHIVPLEGPPNTDPMKIDYYLTTTSQTMVTLQAYQDNDHRIIGYIGKCEVCGKVYHT